MAPATASFALTPTEVSTLEESPDGPIAPATPTVTPTAVPLPTATEVPQEDWVNYLLNHPGYKPEWGEPQYGGIYKTADPRPAFRFQTTLGYGPFSRWQFAAHNSLLMQDPWGTIRDAPICDLCESFEVSADGLTYTFKLREDVQFHEEGWAKDQGAPRLWHGACLRGHQGEPRVVCQPAARDSSKLHQGRRVLHGSP